ncbi:MAG: Holliday junction resolvase RuvX [Pseudomonadales bacterium]|jgi:putative Holliday junction resolvase|nr:Holliday junction resolvase RuvX [Pseudomonadales bacterium]MDP6469462.1 Holliday junction resolvase RuvX [Pseudomonadales bacterium]MDP6827304.1 Holliday junction resolvase RuvX [Pseudomonadales bacterium]MDP6971127.1 Holliday junction resolvase RuvX [Pseudomonadales bacterium]|tara:strand:- start:8322 stop:8720 length:399 start_codon:yes stop_codon:yes gene_type:complete
MPDTDLTILAFDFGTKHIGVATGQTVTDTANGIATVSARRGRPDWSVLDSLVRDWHPSLLVVGLPLNMDGTESDMCAQARLFADRLRSRYQCAVDLIDERLTTVEARTAKVAGSSLHAEAAAIIARGWLERC